MDFHWCKHAACPNITCVSTRPAVCQRTNVILPCQVVNIGMYQGRHGVTHLKIGDDIRMMQLSEDLNLSERACPQYVSICIVILNLELLDSHNTLCPHNPALHDQTCSHHPCLATVPYRTIPWEGCVTARYLEKSSIEFTLTHTNMKDILHCCLFQPCNGSNLKPLQRCEVVVDRMPHHMLLRQ